MALVVTSKTQIGSTFVIEGSGFQSANPFLTPIVTCPARPGHQTSTVWNDSLWFANLYPYNSQTKIWRFDGSVVTEKTFTGIVSNQYPHGAEAYNNTSTHLSSSLYNGTSVNTVVNNMYRLSNPATTALTAVTTVNRSVDRAIWAYNFTLQFSDGIDANIMLNNADPSVAYLSINEISGRVDIPFDIVNTYVDRVYATIVIDDFCFVCFKWSNGTYDIIRYDRTSLTSANITPTNINANSLAYDSFSNTLYASATTGLIYTIEDPTGTTPTFVENTKINEFIDFANQKNSLGQPATQIYIEQVPSQNYRKFGMVIMISTASDYKQLYYYVADNIRLWQPFSPKTSPNTIVPIGIINNKLYSANAGVYTNNTLYETTPDAFITLDGEFQQDRMVSITPTKIIYDISNLDTGIYTLHLIGVDEYVDLGQIRLRPGLLINALRVDP